MIRINNKNCLIENGNTKLARKAREIALASLEFAIRSVDPRLLMRSKLQMTASCLRANEYSFDMKNFKHVYVVGGGKASAAMADALEEILCEKITNGIINVPYNTVDKTRIVQLNEASHPIPDEAGVKGTRRMMEIAEKAEENDLLICLISGGGSSLMPLPRPGVSLKEKRVLTDALLKSGAPIYEINVVRKHLSSFKGGWLAKTAYPATVLNLVLSDVIGDCLDAIASGPTVADPSTFSDAVKIIRKYDLWLETPPSIRGVLISGLNGLLTETPKPGDPAFKKVCNVIIGNNHLACQGTVDALKAKGLNTILSDKILEGEARTEGKKLLCIMDAIAASGNPVNRPVGVVAGGETTVKVLGEGNGGRNQELALSAALSMTRSVAGLAIASLSTDGIDGPTDAAGAIVDNCTLDRAEKLGLDPKEFLANNDSYTFFSRLNDLIKTGPTGTNVNDITVIVLL